MTELRAEIASARSALEKIATNWEAPDGGCWWCDDIGHDNDDDEELNDGSCPVRIARAALRSAPTERDEPRVERKEESASDSQVSRESDALSVSHTSPAPAPSTASGDEERIAKVLAREIGEDWEYWVSTEIPTEIIAALSTETGGGA